MHKIIPIHAQVTNRAGNITTKKEFKPWTQTEIETLVRRYNNFDVYEYVFKRLPTRSYAATRKKVHNLIKKGVLDKKQFKIQKAGRPLTAHKGK